MVLGFWVLGGGEGDVKAQLGVGGQVRGVAAAAAGVWEE